MATAQQQRTNGETVHHETTDNSSLLEDVIAKTPIGRIGERLEKRIDTLDALLPDGMKGQSPRLIKRALLTLARKPEVLECTEDSILQGICTAAELGLAIDGRLAYLVAYNVKVSKKGEPDRYEQRAQMQLDWKGIVAVAKRNKQIVDCVPDIVFENDEFECWREDGVNHIKHRPAKLGTPRGNPLGWYATFTLPHGGCDYEVMDKAEVDRIKGKSKMPWGAWKTDYNEMGKKCPIKRGLKRYSDDPILARAVEIDDAEYEGEPIKQIGPTRIQRAETGHRAVQDFTPELAEAAQEFVPDELPEQPSRDAGKPSEASAEAAREAVNEKIEAAKEPEAFALEQRPSARKPQFDESDPILKDVYAGACACENLDNIESLRDMCNKAYGKAPKPTIAKIKAIIEWRKKVLETSPQTTGA